MEFLIFKYFLQQGTMINYNKKIPNTPGITPWKLMRIWSRNFLNIKDFTLPFRSALSNKVPFSSRMENYP